ncbi:MAG: hypothetical protein ACKOXG_10735 [Arenimonas sp.]
MDGGDSLQAFAAKWRAVWPEQTVLDLFVPPAQRLPAAAWASLLFELHSAAFTLEHEAVRDGKTGWWSDELQRLQDGAPRHPLTQALADVDAPFAAMAAPMLAVVRDVPILAGDTAALLARLRPFAEAVSACEAAVFASRARAADADALVAEWLVLRLPDGLAAFDRGMLPFHLRARYAAFADNAPPPGLRRDWLVELDAALPRTTAGNWFREAQRRFLRRRIRALAIDSGVRPGPGHVWDAWRAVRLR